MGKEREFSREKVGKEREVSTSDCLFLVRK